MKIGVIGLGLIGGSFCKAYKIDKHTVLGYDIDSDILDYAVISGVLNEKLTKENIKSCDIILIATPPKATISFLNEYAPCFGKKQLVIDCCGIKKPICKTGFELAEKYGFMFVGGHPMAGTQFVGLKNSKADMFKGATMALIPPVQDDISITEKAKNALTPAGFLHYSIWTAEEHDKIIAFTSQLAHIVSNAYIKSPSAKLHKGLSAGSYRDLTRVARLNVNMWTELFSENNENLIEELNTIIHELEKYKTALINNDEEYMKYLLEEGSNIKQEVDGFNG